jgi:hypothetical protein
MLLSFCILFVTYSLNFMNNKNQKKKASSLTYNFIQPFKVSKNIIQYINFYCAFETLPVNSVHYVTCFSIVGPDFNYSSFISLEDTLNIKLASENLILHFINCCTECLQNSNFKQKNMTVKVLFFFHNFSKFDSTFLIQTLTNYKDFSFKIKSRNNLLYKLNVINSSIKNKKLNILTFRDAFLLLNLSLEDIGHIFCKSYKKLSFSFLNSTLSIYNKYNILALTFTKELEICCLNDALILQEGFSVYISNTIAMFNINPTSTETLSGLSFLVFKKFFYDFKNTPIEILRGDTYDFIRSSYKGGTADIYKPFLEHGFHYDVNSLYPYVMSEFKYPVGKGQKMEADQINFDTFFGFLEVEVFCPSALIVPTLLLQYNSVDGLFAPTGKWQDIYFSEELKVAKTLGYTFKIIKGIEYKQGKPFSKFVDTLYTLRMEHPKNSANNIILKLIMNSLYGRFGMKPGVPVTDIVSFNEYIRINAVFDILSTTRINEKYRVSYVRKREAEKESILTENFKNGSFPVCEKESPYRVTPIQIACAIAAYGRIVIHKYKVDSTNEVYYSDTDSLFCKEALHSKFISKLNLGFMKLVGEVRDAYFIGPRLYACYYVNKSGAKIVSKGFSKGLLKFEDIAAFYRLGVPKEFIKTQFFKKNYKTFIIRVENHLVTFNPSFKKGVKIFSNGLWVATTPHHINTLVAKNFFLFNEKITNYFFRIFAFYFSLIFFLVCLFY